MRRLNYGDVLNMATGTAICVVVNGQRYAGIIRRGLCIAFPPESGIMRGKTKPRHDRVVAFAPQGDVFRVCSTIDTEHPMHTVIGTGACELWGPEERT